MSQDYEDYEEVYYTIETTIELTRLGSVLIERCIQIGVVKPTRPDPEAARFSQSDIIRLQKVRRLIKDLGLNWAGVEIVMRLMDELETTRTEMTRLQARLL